MFFLFLILITMFSIQIANNNLEMSSESKSGNFIKKLNSILNNAQYSDVIKFDKSGTMIDILNEEKMEKQVIPAYYRHSKFQSFVRQLNLYGFKKIKAHGRHRFAHAELSKGFNLTSICSHKNATNFQKIQKQMENQMKKVSLLKSSEVQMEETTPPHIYQQFPQILQCQNSSSMLCYPQFYHPSLCQPYFFMNQCNSLAFSGFSS